MLNKYLKNIKQVFEKNVDHVYKNVEQVCENF